MKQVTVSVDDETAEELKEVINKRRDMMARHKEQLRHGQKTGSNVAELESHDTDIETAVRASIQFTLGELE